MKKIISIIRPFCVNQECYLYENGVKIKNFTIPLSDFKETIMNYVEKESVTKLELLGSLLYLQGVKKQLEEFEMTKYQKNRLKIEII